MEAYFLTNKVKSLISYAETISEGPVEPLDLFLGAALVKKGTLLEMYLLVEEEIHDLLVLKRAKEEMSLTHKDFSTSISKRTEQVWKRALEIMNNYNQQYLNEGHVIKAFYQLWSEDERRFLKELPHERIKAAVTTARDLLVSMNTYSKKEFKSGQAVIERAGKKDQQAVLKFVEENFGGSWTESIHNGFLQKEIPIFLAWDGASLIGFSSYDVYRGQKGIYGPMGVLKDARNSRVGSRLLHEALQDMKEKRYAYIVLGEAGPIEYYEKECGAALIPLSQS
ncbi:GNAT family N-acetyltransferase [Rossellomorea vietnamensis]|uniref:GNAT family N-acetyltransferase n=1 Tax=Rossellomorea vietnamensis TaxID=218284 RepID=A0A5D4MJ08_9BACI|nr:GNAT family N-acetyltransferase [Rossellomorea vietnamensis]TYS01587.1 GNAT family N-acetyltransferase [Rossellomorea vietnamensis]